MAENGRTQEPGCTGEGDFEQDKNLCATVQGQVSILPSLASKLETEAGRKRLQSPWGRRGSWFSVTNLCDSFQT